MITSFFTPLDEPPVSNDSPFEGPPRSIPGHSGQHAILHRSPTLVVAVHRFESFSTGFMFTVKIEGRGHGQGRFHFLFHPDSSWAEHQPDHDPDTYEKPDQQFRLGLTFSDGTSWENFIETDRPGPDIRTVGGTGSDTGCSQGFWVPALPPPGQFSIHALWPSVGMEECSATFDADELIDAALEEVRLLDDDPELHN